MYTRVLSACPFLLFQSVLYQRSQCTDIYHNAGTISESLFKAIMEVESGGDINAVGDGGKSIGPFQIQRGYWEDAVQQDSSLTEGGKSYESCRGEGSVEYSKRVMQVGLGLGLGLGLKEEGRVATERGAWSIPRE